MLLLIIPFFGLLVFAVDTARKLIAKQCELDDLGDETVALEIALAQITRQRDHLADVLARYEAPLELKAIHWIVRLNGWPLLTLN